MKEEHFWVLSWRLLAPLPPELLAGHCFVSSRRWSGVVKTARCVLPASWWRLAAAHFFAFQGRPAVVLQPRAGEFVALSAVCTHLGCIIKWIDETQEFLCPCHAGRFANSGQVLGGPPPRALDTYPVTLDGDDILIG
jgi:Rieske Fe-S protein